MLPKETMDAPSLELFNVISQGFEQSDLVKHVPIHPVEGMDFGRSLRTQTIL